MKYNCIFAVLFNRGRIEICKNKQMPFFLRKEQSARKFLFNY